ncbi:MAG: M28 family peptidase [Myxococcota bacterium]|nr:M28 family peptidase [Myxococcota bacterium]
MEARPFIEQLRLFEDRFAGGLGERSSQEAMAGLYRRLGYAVRVEGCVCHTNPALLWLLHAVLLAAGALLAAIHPMSGLVATLLGLLSLHGEVASRRRLVRWFLPKGISGNLIARRPRSDGVELPRILFVAHGDVARRGLIHHNWLARHVRGAAGRFKVHPLRLVLALGWFQAAMIALRLPGLHLEQLDRLLLPTLAAFTLVLLLSLDWMRPRAAAGANDNGSGLAVIAALAEHFSQHPARNAEVCFLVSGAREAQSEGMDSFLTTFGRTLLTDDTFVINVDDVGAGMLGFGVAERTPAMLMYAPLLPGLAASIARNEPFRDVRPFTQLGIGDAGVATRHGYAAITLKALRNGRPATPIHTARDRMRLLEPRAMARAFGFARRLAERLDSELGDPPARTTASAVTPGDGAEVS